MADDELGDPLTLVNDAYNEGLRDGMMRGVILLREIVNQAPPGKSKICKFISGIADTLEAESNEVASEVDDKGNG